MSKLVNRVAQFGIVLFLGIASVCLMKGRPTFAQPGPPVRLVQHPVVAVGRVSIPFLPGATAAETNVRTTLVGSGDIVLLTADTYLPGTNEYAPPVMLSYTIAHAPPAVPGGSRNVVKIRVVLPPGVPTPREVHVSWAHVQGTGG